LWQSTESVKLFITRTSRKIVLAGLIVGLAVALVSLLLAHWLTRPIKRLTAYAVGVRNGGRGPLPELGRGEMAVMGRALEEMRDALEGKRYIEEYIQALTHEIKAPLTSIRGAAELLQEEMPAVPGPIPGQHPAGSRLQVGRPPSDAAQLRPAGLAEAAR
jgi:two-component system sensor histidine kinase CreC